MASGANLSSDSSDGEEPEEPSSLEQPDVENVLANFRENWQKEIRSSPKKQTLVNKNKPSQEEAEKSIETEEQARKLFEKGIELEKSGKLYEAIQFYRRAVQIVPDIEFRLDTPKHQVRERRFTENVDDAIHEELQNSNSEDSDTEVIENGQLLSIIQKKVSKGSPLCFPKFDQSATHISTLPIEIILLILKWLVSNDLDLRSLESFAKVCRGFYLCSRDQEIWRLSCLRVWGLNCGSTPGNYGSWRDMFIERARIQFNGCYISKTTYIRHGENSFQDQFYRPWYLVAYYRYFRFFPDGKVLVLTSAEEPAQCVGLLKYRNAKNPVLSGYYRIKDDKVTLIVQKVNDKIVQGYKKSKRRDNMYESAEQTFHMELQIKDHRHKKHVQLIWTHYSIFTRTMIGDESTCNFDLISSSFPPLWFSRVKSYTIESESPLQ